LFLPPVVSKWRQIVTPLGSPPSGVPVEVVGHVVLYKLTDERMHELQRCLEAVLKGALGLGIARWRLGVAASRDVTVAIICSNMPECVSVTSARNCSGVTPSTSIHCSSSAS